jgi:hypothetical protein
MENHLHLVVFPEEQVKENSQFRFYAVVTVIDKYNEERKNRLIDCIDARATQALERGKTTQSVVGYIPTRSVGTRKAR